jgi:Protein of unknown function (DUF3309)
MPLGTILLIILVLLLIGALPAWPYAAAWGPAPAGILGGDLDRGFDPCSYGQDLNPAKNAASHRRCWWRAGVRVCA